MRGINFLVMTVLLQTPDTASDTGYLNYIVYSSLRLAITSCLNASLNAPTAKRISRSGTQGRSGESVARWRTSRVLAELELQPVNVEILRRKGIQNIDIGIFIFSSHRWFCCLLDSVRRIFAHQTSQSRCAADPFCSTTDGFPTNLVFQKTLFVWSHSRSIA
ncbi:hypothetical protein K438DRAFT_996058 [Mycena galopus ATCC 62051]|nr:hypothetical protein K438DRAFT_996058 [Mycena galopus ATCC 62051]